MSSSIEKRLERLEAIEAPNTPWERVVVDGTRAEHAEQMATIEAGLGHRNIVVRVIVPAIDQSMDDVQALEREQAGALPPENEVTR